jgi:hypothetical protein
VRSPLGKIEDCFIHDGGRYCLGHVICYILPHGDDPDGYAKYAVNASDVASVRRPAADRCSFRSVQITAMMTTIVGDLVYSVWKMIWNNILSVSLWSQANITATNLEHQLCSYTIEEIYGQQRSWSCLYTFKSIKSGKVRNSFFMISVRTLFYLSDDYLVEDDVLLPFGLCHQRCTTTSLSLIPRFNGGDPIDWAWWWFLKIFSSILLSLKCIRHIDRRESHPRGINWYGAWWRPLKIADAAISSPCCRRMNDRCLAS